ncbi:MAG: methyltransferase domain-containing protein [Thermoplasmata archaeon]|nr:methyltransferase domain-containing protein [Thermoplasmata archaeon]
MKKANYDDIAADTFDLSRPISEERLKTWLDLISENVNHKEKIEFLDLGCGTGRFSIPIAKRLGYSVTGADNSEEMLVKARKKDEASQVKWDIQDATSLSYPDASFDAVFMSHLLHHVDDPSDIVNECYRVLRPGGTILNRYGSMEDIRDDPEHRFFPGTIEFDETRTPTLKQVEDIFQNAGFKDVSSKVLVEEPYPSPEVRLRGAELKFTSVLTLIDQSEFEKGLENFRKYISDNPGDHWLLEDRMTLTSGKKSD